MDLLLPERIVKRNEYPDWLPIYYQDIDRKDLPISWQQEIYSAVDNYSKRIVLTGESETSFEDQSEILVDVLQGELIQQHLPWLYKLYYGKLYQFVQQQFSAPVYVSNQPSTAINVNRLSGIGARYEWHIDTNDVTGLLFVDDFSSSDGGALVFKKGKEEVSIYPKAGRFYCFLTKNLPHGVEPLRNALKPRLSLPMNYYWDKNNKGRDPEVDAYLNHTVSKSG